MRQLGESNKKDCASLRCFPGGTFPFTATDTQTHAFITAVHTVTLTVVDDDGGSVTLFLSSSVSPAKGILTSHDVGSRHLLVQEEEHTSASNPTHVRDSPPFDPPPPSGT